MDSKTLKKLLKVVLLTVVISFAMDKLVFFGLNTISDKVMTGQAIGKLNHFLKVKDTADLLIFGNSRANHHIDVSAMSANAFNMGVDATGIAYSSTLINTLSEDKAQQIIVHVDTKNFIDVDYEGTDIRGLKSKFKRNKSITKALKKSGQISPLQQFYYSMNYNGNAIGIIKNYLKPNYDYTAYNGYDPLIVSASKASKRDAVLAREITAECPERYEINAVALDYLKSIQSYMKNSNKQFIFITSPTYDDSCSKDNALLEATMKDLGLPYKDYSNLFKEKIANQNAYWNDKTHLSKDGADAFTAYLIKDLKSNKFN